MKPASSNTALELVLQNVGKSFGPFQALRDINLAVRQGEFVCLLGPSGCGKTTLLRMIAGLESCEQGQIMQAGRDITRASPAQRDYGIVFQSYALFPNLRVDENIAYGLKANRQAKQARVQELLEMIGLPGIAEKFPAQLSGGQQQRVALARALANQPQLLLLDEPLSALDAQVRQHLRGEIKALQQKLGVTTIMVTHDQEEALTMADRIVVMNHGVIEQIGTPEEIYHRPASRFVADFIGLCNWLDVQVLDAGHVSFAGASLQLPSADGDLQGIGLRDIGLQDIGIRPEQIQVLPLDAQQGNCVRAQLQQITLSGGSYRLQFALSKGSSLEVASNGREIAALNLQIGQHLQLHLPPHALCAFTRPPVV